MSLQLWQHQVESDDGPPVRMDLRSRESEKPSAAVVICHGFKGFKDWGFFPYLSEQLAEAGYAVLSLDFSHNGIAEQAGEFTRLDLFAKNNYTHELRDLKLARQWLDESSPLAAELSGRPVGVLAHSRGAVPAIVHAVEDSRVKAIVSWNGVSRALRSTQRQLDQWETDGLLEFTNARTGQRMSIHYDFVVDCMEQRERLDLVAQLGRSQAAHLIIQGTADMAVDGSEAEELLAAREKSGLSELLWIENGTHTFGAVHPFEGSTPHLDEAIDATRAWFSTHLTS